MFVQLTCENCGTDNKLKYIFGYVRLENNGVNLWEYCMFLSTEHAEYALNGKLIIIGVIYVKWYGDVYTDYSRYIIANLFHLG